MAEHFVDPGYGDPLAPVGSAEWAKRWRLVIQGAVKELPKATGHASKLFDIGEQHRAWTLITNDKGQAFPDFDTFCAYKQPWGLGMDPTKFRAHLAAEMGKKAADLATVAPGDDVGGRPRKGEETGDTVSPVSSGQAKKEKRLRAILRAPELIQDLYRQGLVSQTVAASMGPRKPDEDKAAQVVRARNAVEALPKPADDPASKNAYRKQVDKTIRLAMGKEGPTPLDHLRNWWKKATPEQRTTFLNEIEGA